MKLFFKTLATVTKGISKALALKRTSLCPRKKQCKLRTESVKNRTDCKDEFFRDTSVPQIRKLKTRERYNKS